MDPKPAGEKNRPRYFSNVKTRLGSKLPASAPPPGFPLGPWEPHCSRSGPAREGGASQNRPQGHAPLTSPTSGTPSCGSTI
ncbi:hypothetical protein ANANG_G00004650 [Anguilla anguilla]|uniref:Uncharacterized protein n=1 Tax=Anguilla anguilla TaxID=7936 RepID=A0A9D3MZD6_ANGAN|nr:hypothetical protein ANANG_G00004650 [Anguilla anguilla]